MSVRNEVRELLSGTESVKVFNVGHTKITLSKAHSPETEAELPEPFPDMGVDADTVLDSWLT